MQPGGKKILCLIFAVTLMAGGITPQCAPGDFHFDPELFFNTEYHLNKRGAVLRSENLARCINKVLAQAD